MREGRIVPLQDATSLGKQKLANNTWNLQQQPVDFHVNPLCQDKQCLAIGDYINDDGETVVLEGNQNVYKLLFSQDLDKPQDLIFSVDMSSSASNFDFNYVNDNDKLGRLEIHNALAMSYQGSYTVTLTKNDNSTQVMQNTADYDQ